MELGLIKAAIGLTTQFVKLRAAARPKVVRAVGAEVKRHLHEALTWSSRIQFYGMSRAEETELATIALRLTDEPRRFRAQNVHQPKTEDLLLADDRNYLLLGD